MKGDLDKAEEQLAALERICLIPCEEYDDLTRAIAQYNKIVMHYLETAMRLPPSKGTVPR